ncbi:MAG: lyase family protein [Patescibacteria group bacterium]
MDAKGKKGKEKKKKEGQQRNVHECISVVDHRYYVKEVANILSSTASLRYLCKVEVALVKTLERHGLCDKNVVKEVERACEGVTMDEVAAEELRTKHDIRALVNCIQRNVSDGAKPYVHATATSYDIVDTAKALQYQEAMNEVVLPELMALERTLIELALKEAETVQIGRTHGQHAVPITFGFAVANYVNRLGDCIAQLRKHTKELRGKFSGAVGAYNASSLFFALPERFEQEVLGELQLEPALCTTQIVPPEPIIRLMHECASAAGVMANIARDMRHLQRTEIDEMGEEFDDAQVGSSTMAHKKNPVTFENIESIWKIIVGRMVTIDIDQISEHQRDLTGSASSRTYPEVINYVVYMSRRLNRAMKKLKVNHAGLVRSLQLQSGLIIAEPLYLILAMLGHPDAHEKVKKLSMRARGEKKALEELAKNDPELQPYFKKMTKEQKLIFMAPDRLYTGIAAKKAKDVAHFWADALTIHLIRR